MPIAQKKRILIADDDPGMRLALAIRLRANNFDVSCAGDGLATVDEARRQSPDLILLDLGMPSGDGFVVLEMLRNDEPDIAIPIIVLTGRDRAGNRSRALNAGALMFLQKPVENALLLASISKALEMPAAARSHAERPHMY